MRASLASYARYWREAFRLPSMDHRSWPCGSPKRPGARAPRRGAGRRAAAWSSRCRTAGTGTWPECGWPRRTAQFTTVAERLKPESLYRRFIAYRESLGFEVLPLTGGERHRSRCSAERLRGQRVVCLMAERDLSRTGVEVDFFGEPTRMPAGPAKLAIETGAALLPVHCWFDGDGWRFESARRWTAPAATSRRHPGARRRLRQNIAAHPADWHMMQPQWLADLSDERRDRSAGQGDA